MPACARANEVEVGADQVEKRAEEVGVLWNLQILTICVTNQSRHIILCHSVPIEVPGPGSARPPLSRSSTCATARPRPRCPREGVSPGCPSPDAASLCLPPMCPWCRPAAMAHPPPPLQLTCEAVPGATVKTSSSDSWPTPMALSRQWLILTSCDISLTISAWLILASPHPPPGRSVAGTAGRCPPQP